MEKARYQKAVMLKGFCSASQPCKQLDPEQRHLRMTLGFTLVEILVVVLIIGILTAIAVPMYQSAVDKTHWSTLLPTARALKNAEEAYLMATNVYTDNADTLDVAATQGDATYQLQMPGSDSLYAIRATTPKLPSVRLAQYLDDNAMRAGQLYCEASDGEDGRGTKLCEKLLNGQELGTTDDGYTQYLLDQEVDKATCDGVNRFFGQKTKKCYKTNAERCVGLGMPYNTNTEICGYTGRNNHNLEVDEGGICHGYTSCNDSSFNGAVCIGDDGCYRGEFSNSVCLTITRHSSNACYGSTFDNSLCISKGFYGGCSSLNEKQSTFSNDSVCYAGDEVYSAYGCARAIYNDTSCCCGGNSCPAAHRCSEARCAQVEQQVQQIESQYPYQY